jgi:hypothetical protein
MTGPVSTTGATFAMMSGGLKNILKAAVLQGIDKVMDPPVMNDIHIKQRSSSNAISTVNVKLQNGSTYKG